MRMTAQAMTAEALAAMVAPIADQQVETCVILYFDAAGRLSGTRHVGGSATTVDVSVRALVGDALALDARSVVVAHNHPGGDPAASRDDLTFTRRLVRGLAAIEVGLVDHLIVARGGRATSLRAKGYL